MWKLCALRELPNYRYATYRTHQLMQFANRTNAYNTPLSCNKITPHKWATSLSRHKQIEAQAPSAIWPWHYCLVPINTHRITAIHLWGAQDTTNNSLLAHSQCGHLVCTQFALAQGAASMCCSFSNAWRAYVNNVNERCWLRCEWGSHMWLLLHYVWF